MAFKTSKGKDAMFTEINITPLTDIFLVLLIIMMVIAPTFQAVDNNINIPEINSGIAIEQKNATVSVTKEGLFYINGKQIPDTQLLAELQTLKPSLEKKEVVVKADTDVKNSEIMKIMKAAQEAEYAKLIVAGEPLSKKEQNQLNTVSYSNETTIPTTTAISAEQTSTVNLPSENKSSDDWNE